MQNDVSNLDCLTLTKFQMLSQGLVDCLLLYNFITHAEKKPRFCKKNDFPEVTYLPRPVPIKRNRKSTQPSTKNTTEAAKIYHRLYTIFCTETRRVQKGLEKKYVHNFSKLCITGMVLGPDHMKILGLKATNAAFCNFKPDNNSMLGP